MKRTYELVEPEHFHFEDGTTEDREKVTVSPFGKTLSGRTVWADVDDDSMCYLVHGYSKKLWYYDGQIY